MYDNGDMEAYGANIEGLGDLLARARGGDRDAGADLMARYRSRIRRRIRGKLGPAMRRLFDSGEVLSTVARRLDTLISSGRLRAATDGQFWALVFRMAENSLIEKARVFRTLQAQEGEDGELAYRMLDRMRTAERRDHDGPEVELDLALRTLGDGLDRQILSLWLMGNQPTSIAAAVNMPPATVRKRWERIRGQLRVAIASGAC